MVQNVDQALEHMSKEQLVNLVTALREDNDLLPQPRPADAIGKRAAAIMRECIQLQEQKGKEYGGVSFGDYLPLGMDSLFTILNLKLTRVRSLMIIGAAPESYLDSLRDLLVYSALGLAWVEQEYELGGSDD